MSTSYAAERSEAAQRTSLVFAPRLHEDEGPYVHYSQVRAPRGHPPAFDVRDLIREHQADWLEQLDDWHRAVGEIAARHDPRWWLLRSSRLAAWYPLDLKPIFFALAIVEHCRQVRPASLRLIGCPGTVREIVARWFEQNRAGAVTGGTDQNGQSGAIEALYRGQGPIAALRELGSLGSQLARPRAATKPSASSAVVVSATLSAQTLRQTGDHFFGRMFDNGGSPAAPLWCYQLSRGEDLDAVREACRSFGRSFTFEHEWLRLGDVLSIIAACVSLKRALRSARDELPPLRIADVDIPGFTERFWRIATAEWPIPELATARAMRRLLAHVRPSLVIYPYEEKGIERAILSACGSVTPPPRTIGFAHANYNSGHIFLRRGRIGEPPRPAAVAATGPAAAEWLSEAAGMPSHRLCVLGSPRALVARRPSSAPSVPLRVLVLIGLGPELTVLATFVEELPTLFARCVLTIRRYPHAWHVEQDEGEARLRAAGVTFTTVGGDLATQVASADVALFASTSAGLEAMLMECVTVSVAIDDWFDADPISGKTGTAEPAVLRCRTARQLQPALDDIARLDREGYRALAQRQRAFAERVYAPPQPAPIPLALAAGC